MLLWNYSFRGTIRARQKVYQLITKLSSLNASQSRHKTKQFSRLICEGSRYCFPRRKFVKIMLPGTTSHLLQTSMINYEFNNHLSTMLCVINVSSVSASCNLFAGQEVWTTVTITPQSRQSTSLFSLPSLHHSPHTSYQTTESNSTSPGWLVLIHLSPQHTGYIWQRETYSL